MFLLLFIILGAVALALAVGIGMVLLAGISTLITSIRDGYRSAMKASR